MHSRRQIVEANYVEYQKLEKKAKAALLDRLVPTCGMNRDYLAHVLSIYVKERVVDIDGKPVKLVAAAPRKKRDKGKRGGRPTKYDAAFVVVLADIWEHNEYQCGKLLSAFIRDVIDFLQESKAPNPDYGITAEIRAKLVTVSPAEIDILLKPARKQLEIRGKSLTKSVNTPLKQLIPVRTYFKWEDRKPGNFAFDTVAHCGGSAAGQFCRTLTGTDVGSGWTEERSLLNNAQRWTAEAISNIRSELPFPLLEGHTDNGGEFINDWLYAWFQKNKIAFTRSRSHHSNDNCFVEQKNGDIVRKTVGYFRFDTPAEQKELAEVYRCLCPLLNYWYPTMKLTNKTRLDDGRYKKIYEKTPKTPYQRLLEAPELAEECKAELRWRKTLYNPVLLKRCLDEARDRLLRLNMKKGTMYLPSGQEAEASL
jgi:hypothetical protein